MSAYLPRVYMILYARVCAYARARACGKEKERCRRRVSHLARDYPSLRVSRNSVFGTKKRRTSVKHVCRSKPENTIAFDRMIYTVVGIRGSPLHDRPFGRGEETAKNRGKRETRVANTNTAK
jgi:hypothetical protein